MQNLPSLKYNEKSNSILNIQAELPAVENNSTTKINIARLHEKAL